MRTRSALLPAAAFALTAGTAWATDATRTTQMSATAGPAIVTTGAPPAPVGQKPAPDGQKPTPGPRGELTVTVDRAKVIRLPDNVQTVILGNPSIADLAVQKSGLAVLTGKSYGVTNLIALDASGTMLAESTVSVVAPSEALVTVQRGLERQSLSCTPSCQPSVVLGDALPYFTDVKGQADQHRQFSLQR